MKRIKCDALDPTGCLFIGFDTSNYCTSAAVFSDAEEKVVFNFKKLLPVKHGEKGLRQNDAVFLHVRQAGEMTEKLNEAFGAELAGRVRAVAFSGSPRSLEGSYMPCFLVGETIGLTVSSVLSVPYYRVSHQDGHVAAAVYSVSKNENTDPFTFFSRQFISFHVSGGTFDVLLVSPSTVADRIFDVRRIGGTLDASAGQIVDRIGVLMGIDFPCGAEMDSLALSYKGASSEDTVSVKGLDCNMSGLENRASKLLTKGASHEEVSAYVLDSIGTVIEKIALNAEKIYGDIPVIFAGGVMSSGFIKKRLKGSGFFADPVYSSDNAAGVAFLASELYKMNH